MELPVLLTCTVKVQDTNVKIAARDERLIQYQEAVKNWILLGAKSIVICENSQDKILNSSLLALAEEHDATIEEISFKGDSSSISIKGKGYGEGEIINKAIYSSSLIKKYGCFYKVTGRLWVDNIKSINQTMANKQRLSYFYKVDSTKVDTRFFFTSVPFYDKYLQNIHEEVNDSTGKYLEHCFHEKLISVPKITRVCIPYPKVIGLSGSTGGSYELPTWRFSLKNILSIFMYYGKTYE